MRNLNLHILYITTILLSSVAFGQKDSYKNITIKDGLPQSDIFDAVQDSIGYVWFATQGGGITKFDGKNFIVYNQNNGLLSNYSNSLLIQKNRLYIGTNKGLSILSKESFTNYKSPKINTVSELNGNIYLGTNEGVYAFKDDYVIPIKLSLKIDLSKIVSITYQNSYYWIETEQNLWKLKTLSNPKTINKASNIESSTYLSNAKKLLNTYQKLDDFKNTKLTKVFIDNTQNTWLLSKGNGIYQSLKSNFKHFDLINSKKVGEIAAIHKTKNAIWFSDSNSIFKKDSSSFHIVDKQGFQFKTTTISSDHNNNLWIGSKNKGIFIFRKIKDTTLNNRYKIERLHINNGLPSNQITSIQIQKNVIWLSTKRIGIVKLEYDFDNEFVKNIRVFNKSNGVKDVDFTATLIHKDKFWYGTKNGALGYIKNNTVTHFSNTTVQKTAISSLAIKNNKLLIGTLGQGLYYLENEKINQLNPYNNNFLSSLNVYQILVDHSNNVWVGSEKGLDKLVFEKKQIKKTIHFNVNDGFLGIETSFNTSIEANNYELWFGTKNGITNYTDSINHRIKNSPTLYFEDIKIDNILLENLKRVTISDVLQLEPLQNNISFSFKSIDLNHPDRIEYQWKLNDQTSSWTKEDKINFANLKAGNYSFSVRAKNAEKLISNSKMFQFHIDKPMYRKTWFLAISAFILLLIILTFITSYINGIKNKNKEEIAKLRLENHLINLEQKALQLQMNPHFIFNVLNSIKALGNKNDKTELNNTISSFASLLRAILHNSRKEEISLSEEINTLKNYMDLENKMAFVPFSYSIENNISSIDLEEILIPPMLLQPFVENCIKHGFNGINKEGLITIEFSNKNNQLVCKINDNGIGLNMVKRNDHKSVAVKLTKERIKSISKYSSLEISEITKENQTLGTLAIIKIPLKTDF